MALQLSQNLFKSFVDVNNVKAKKNLFRAAFHKLKKAEQDLIVSAVMTYTEVWAARQKLQAHIQKEQNLKKLHESQEVCLSAGMATPADVAEAEAKYQTAVYERVDAETKVVEAEVKFRHITGLEADKRMFIPNLNIKLPKDLDELEKIALRSNQEILQERFSNQAAENELDVAKGELGPKCDLTLRAGRTLNKPDNFYGRDSRNNYSAELSVKVPIFHMQNYANVGIHSEKAKQAKFAAEDKVLEIKKNCKIYWRAYKSAEASIKASSTAVKSAEITSESNLDQTNLGMKSNTEFLDAETSLLTARINLANSIKNKIDAAIQLFALTGNLDLRSMLVTLKKNKGVLDPMAAAKAREKVRKARRSGEKISKEEWVKKLAEKRELAAQKQRLDKLKNQEKVADQRGRANRSVKP
jgi:outer membrane protein TolC